MELSVYSVWIMVDDCVCFGSVNDSTTSFGFSIWLSVAYARSYKMSLVFVFMQFALYIIDFLFCLY